MIRLQSKEYKMKTWLAAACWCLLAGATLAADTLVLRDGRRVQGRLVGLRGDEIEFDGDRGGFFGGRDRIRVDRRDVVRIELDEDRDARDDGDRDDRREGRPAGLRERGVSVDSWVAWTDSGVDVRAGQTIYFSAAGRVRWGPNRQDGPAGERNSPRNDSRPIPGRPAAALIGRVGESGDCFFIGDEEGPMRMRDSGRLHLGVNDDYLKDNTGSFRVTVYY
jgi:hypothetical protein